MEKIAYEMLCNFYSLPIRIIKSSRMRWTGHVAHTDKRNACKLLVWMPEGNRPLGRPRLILTGWGGMDWFSIGTSGWPL
jgi:hypothetical protein